MKNINLAIIQPTGYIHSLGFLDYAEYFAYHLENFGYQCKISKNRLEKDSINLIFGAHLIKNYDFLCGFNKIIVNLENLKYVNNDKYIDLLRQSHTLDYDCVNIKFLEKKELVESVLFSFGWYKRDTASPESLVFESDLLFYGSLNDRRKVLIKKLIDRGLKVTVLAPGIYYRERDSYILKSRAVLNCHFYEQGLFEQARAFVPLSLGVPVFSEYPKSSNSIPENFRRSIFWFVDGDEEILSPDYLRSEDFFEKKSEFLKSYKKMTAPLFLSNLDSLIKKISRSLASPVVPTKINLGSGKDYMRGWLNIDILDRVLPDLVLDLSRCELPFFAKTPAFGDIFIREGTFETIYANNVLEHIPDLPKLMTNCLNLLRLGGVFVIEVPYERSLGAWQDPTHIRAFNENSFLYYTDWFWYLGWKDFRFQLLSMQFCDLQGGMVDKFCADVIKVQLKKINVTLKERSVARAMDPGFGLTS